MLYALADLESFQMRTVSKLPQPFVFPRRRILAISSERGWVAAIMMVFVVKDPPMERKFELDRFFQYWSEQRYNGWIFTSRVSKDVGNSL